jgi:hypothetical protein
MRSAIHKDQFTPFGLWLQQYLRQSGDGLSITNLDYVIEDFKHKRIMLLEEKQNNGGVGRAQLLTFNVLDRALTAMSERNGYEYWGFFVVKFPRGADMPGPGMTINDHLVGADELQRHLNFEEKFCEGLVMPWRTKDAA